MDCVVHRCDNASWKGKMVGNLCKPCHDFFEVELAWLENELGVKYSQASRNRIKEIKNYLMEAELFQVKEKWERKIAEKP